MKLWKRIVKELYCNTFKKNWSVTHLQVNLLGRGNKIASLRRINKLARNELCARSRFSYSHYTPFPRPSRTPVQSRAFLRLVRLPRRRIARICINFKSRAHKKKRNAGGRISAYREGHTCKRPHDRRERSNKANGILLSTKGDGFDPLEMGNAEMWPRRLRRRRNCEFYFYCDQSDVSAARPARGSPLSYKLSCETTLYWFIFKTPCSHVTELARARLPPSTRRGAETP